MIYHNKINTKNDLIIFYIKRFFRIAPLFFVLIPIYYLNFGLNLEVQSSLSDWQHIILHYSFLFGFYPDSMISIIPQAWSIFVEV